jgi:hypothetical protein
MTRTSFARFRRSCLFTLVLTGGSLMASSLDAQVLCSGRCLQSPGGLTWSCSLSLFGQWICVDGQDYCAEFECWNSVSVTPSDQRVAAAGSVSPPAGRAVCSQTTPPATPAETKIQVESLKSRT